MTYVQVNTFNLMVKSLLKYEKMNYASETNFGRTLEWWSLTSWLTFTFKVPIGDLSVGNLQGRQNGLVQCCFNVEEEPILSNSKYEPVEPNVHAEKLTKVWLSILKLKCKCKWMEIVKGI